MVPDDVDWVFRRQVAAVTGFSVGSVRFSEESPRNIPLGSAKFPLNSLGNKYSSAFSGVPEQLESDFSETGGEQSSYLG